jgi:hypothetical protein
MKEGKGLSQFRPKAPKLLDEISSIEKGWCRHKSGLLPPQEKGSEICSRCIAAYTAENVLGGL